MKDTDIEIEKALRVLISTVMNKVKKGKSQGLYKPIQLLYYQRKIDNLAFNEYGFAGYNASIDYVTKDDWSDLSHPISENIKKINEYNIVIKLLIKNDEKNGIRSYGLEQLVRIVILNTLNSKINDQMVDKLISVFLKDLNEEPINCFIKVELDGIIILPQEIHFQVDNNSITLRQIIKEDLEREIPIHLLYSYREPEMQQANAILIIEFPGRDSIDFQMKAEQAITILRLFNIGSIRYIQYHMYSEGIINATSLTLGGGEFISSVEKYQITERDVEKLMKFWEEMKKVIPQDLYDPRGIKFNHISIAYNRYSDALLLNGVVERRIANAVMGFESLFLGEGSQELSYRLRIRVAKVLSLTCLSANLVCRFEGL